MSSRNRIKIYIPEAYYHIYNRGVERRIIFQDDDDYRVFLNLLKRYLDNEPASDRSGREYDWLHKRLELLGYCLQPNHYHLMVYVHDAQAMTRLFRGVNTAYTKYFNKKNDRIGPLFQDRYKASHILNDAYLVHISRYVHLNPKNWRDWPYSSLPYYLGQKNAGWVRPQRLLDLFEGDNYLNFIEDYQDAKKVMDEVKSELADY